MDAVRILKQREIPDRWCRVLRVTLEEGRASLWLDLGNGEQGLYTTRDKRMCSKIGDLNQSDETYLYVQYSGGSHVQTLFGDSSSPDEFNEGQEASEAVQGNTVKPTATVSHLIDSIMAEMHRVWGDNFQGTFEEYDWLLVHYGITEEDDVKWLQIQGYYNGDLLPEEDENEELLQFLRDDQAVQASLEQLLQKYRSNTLSYYR